VAGDWHGNTPWATRAIAKMSRLMPDSGRGSSCTWATSHLPGPAGQEYFSRIRSALAAAAAELWFVDGNHEDFSQLGALRPGPDGGSRSPNASGTCPAATGGAGQRDWLALGGAVSLDRADRTPAPAGA